MLSAAWRTYAEERGADWWRSLLHEYLLSRPCAAVLGTPSGDVAKQIADGDQQRHKEQARRSRVYMSATTARNYCTLLLHATTARYYCTHVK